jgi:hypothetical protein
MSPPFDSFTIEVDGKMLMAVKGQTIAEVLLSNGIRFFRKTRGNAPRGVYCGMGVCFECRMIVDGKPNVRTCMALATPGCRAVTQYDDKLGDTE